MNELMKFYSYARNNKQYLHTNCSCFHFTPQK